MTRACPRAPRLAALSHGLLTPAFVIPERRPSAAKDDVSGIHASPSTPAIRSATRHAPPPRSGRRRPPPPSSLRDATSAPTSWGGGQEAAALPSFLQPHAVGEGAERSEGVRIRKPFRDVGRKEPDAPPASRNGFRTAAPRFARFVSGMTRACPRASRLAALSHGLLTPAFVIPERRPSAAKDGVSGIHASPSTPAIRSATRHAPPPRSGRRRPPLRRRFATPPPPPLRGVEDKRPQRSRPSSSPTQWGRSGRGPRWARPNSVEAS